MLVTTKELLCIANAENKAIGAFNYRIGNPAGGVTGSGKQKRACHSSICTGS